MSFSEIKTLHSMESIDRTIHTVSHTYYMGVLLGSVHINWPNSPKRQWMKLTGSWGTGPSSKTKVSRCGDRWVLAWLSDKISQTWNSRRSMCRLFHPVKHCGGAELKIDHRSLCYAPFWCYLSSSEMSQEQSLLWRYGISNCTTRLAPK